MGIAFGVIIIVIGLIRLLVESSKEKMWKSEKERRDIITNAIAPKKINKELEWKYKNEIQFAPGTARFPYLEESSPEVQKIRKYYEEHKQEVESECDMVLAPWHNAINSKLVKRDIVAKLFLYMDGYYPESSAKLYTGLKVIKNWAYYDKLERECRKKGVQPDWR